ncbi:hypothetical protein I5U45_09330 [Stenotrophomonas maltophilia]|nr:hypothetical protein [Stenotrophomonas maltophilia]MBN5138001.1 hypothetical protein [Stenotrophomonas maltophilia]
MLIAEEFLWKRTSPPPEFLVNEMGELVEQFTVAIISIPPGDSRKPPGDHHGTGWLIDMDGQPHICTCEHVANFQSKGKLAYSCYGSEGGVSVERDFLLKPLPMDFAIASLASSWDVVEHKGVCIPESMIATQHCPVEGEYLYFYGFPGSDAKACFEQHYIQGTGVFLHEVEFVQDVLDEESRADPAMHICMSLSPTEAVPLTAQTGELPLPHGMSGSALWNTRYLEVTNAGNTWSPEDARLTGIVWGASQKAGVVVATPIERFRNLLF